MKLYSFAPINLKLALVGVTLASSVWAATPPINPGQDQSAANSDPVIASVNPEGFNGHQSIISSTNSPLPKNPITISFSALKPPRLPVFGSATVNKPAARVYPQSSYEAMFETYAAQFGVDKELLKQIAYCESHYNPGAVNGPYGGMYQYSASTWASTRNQMGLDPNPDLRFDGEQAILTSAFKIAAGGRRAWPVCAFK
jgi:soluble lytic murein transglycosylase-like protein